MLHLKYLTPPEWASTALSDPSSLLLDHLYCEKKAELQALAIVRKYGDSHPVLVGPMEDLAKEEASHAALCERLLAERGSPRQRHHGNPYVTALRQVGRWRGRGDLLDRLLVGAMIEARSCERFRLLADALRGSGLGRFYEDLFASEARHHALFVSLAIDLCGDSLSRKRLEAVSTVEAEIASSRPWGPFLH